MTELTRYDWGKRDDGEWDILPFTDGDYVKYADVAHLEQQAARLANLPGLPEHAIELAKKLLARQEANKHIDLDSKLAAADRGAIYVAYDLAHIVLNTCYPPAPGQEGGQEGGKEGVIVGSV